MKSQREQCDHMSDHDVVTDRPTGMRCDKDATHRIEWEDGRWSLACSNHLEISPTASVKPTSITALTTSTEPDGSFERPFKSIAGLARFQAKHKRQ